MMKKITSSGLAGKPTGSGLAGKATRDGLQSKPTKRRDSDRAIKRTEMVSVRLGPKLRFAADIAARSQRRTVSSLIEVAVANYLATLGVALPAYEEGAAGRSTTLMKLVESLWDPDESDRFVNLAERQRWLLNNEEDHRWKAIREHFNATGPVTPAQRKELLSVYDEIKDRVAHEVHEKELAKFAKP